MRRPAIARRQSARLCLLIIACAGMLTACSQDDVGSTPPAPDPAGDAISLENLQQSIADFAATGDPPDVPAARWLVPEELDAVLRSFNDESFTVTAPPAEETSVGTGEAAPHQPFSVVIGLVSSNVQMAALEATCPQISPADKPGSGSCPECRPPHDIPRGKPPVAADRACDEST